MINLVDDDGVVDKAEEEEGLGSLLGLDITPGVFGSEVGTFSKDGVFSSMSLLKPGIPLMHHTTSNTKKSPVLVFGFF